jgi:hypothetical protein
VELRVCLFLLTLAVPGIFAAKVRLLCWADERITSSSPSEVNIGQP